MLKYHIKVKFSEIMKKLFYLALVVTFAYACSGSGSNGDGDTASSSTTNETSATKATTEVTQAEYDALVGEGKFSEDNFEFSQDPEMSKNGNAIYSAKCQSCHKLTDEQLVGPGFKGVSERRTPVWIMNFLTNTDEMIDLDPALQEQLEVCMVRMPDQALTDDDALAMVNFFHENDKAN